MGLFSRIFSSDPSRDLERAEALLHRGEAQRALELALRAEEKSSAEERDKASAIVAHARHAFTTTVLERVHQAESSGHYEDAAEWLDIALGYTVDATQRKALQERRAQLDARAEEARVAEEQAAFDRAAEDWATAPQDEATTEIDPESHFHALIDMLEENVAERYEDRPDLFRLAFMALNQGLPEDALPILEDLATKNPNDAVIRLERGRAYLASGNATAACADFEAAWPSFGDAPLDRGHTLSVPGLWAEAMLAQENAAPVLERLRELAAPSEGNAVLSGLFAEALLLAEDFEHARRFCSQAAATFPSEPLFPHHLALALARLDEPDAAIDCLETAIAPSCTSGSCSRPPRHLPSLRLLAQLYLDRGASTERTGQLLSFIGQDLRGQLTDGDMALMERFREQRQNA